MTDIQVHYVMITAQDGAKDPRLATATATVLVQVGFLAFSLTLDLDMMFILKTSLGIAFKPFEDITTHINIIFKGAVHNYCDTPLYFMYNLC